MTDQLIPIPTELLVDEDKKVKELMTPLEDFPHIPHWFSLSQAMATLREASSKSENGFETQAVLVHDEKHQLIGILTIRDIIKGLEPKSLYETSLIKGYPNLLLLMKGISRANLQVASQQQVSGMVSPIKVTVDADADITTAFLLMAKEGVGMIPVILDHKVTGMICLGDLYKEISKAILGH